MEIQIPLTLIYWAAAFLPILALLLLLVTFRWGAAEAGPVAWLIATVIALTLYRAPFQVVALESVKGVWSAVFSILIVIWPAILIYEVTREAQAFEPFRRGLEQVTPHRLLQVMAFGWGFAGFLQGIMGFGVPVAVCAPLLVGIGVSPLYAVVITLVGHAWNNTFGTLAVAWLALKEVTALSGAQAALTALYAAAFIGLFNIIAGFLICWFYGRGKAIKEGLPAVLIISLMQGGATVALSQWNDSLNGFIAGIFGFLVIFPLARTPWYRKPSAIAPEKSPALASEGLEAASLSAPYGTEVNPGGMGFHLAFSPYYALLVITFGVLLTPLVKVLDRFAIGLPFPETITGFSFTNPATAAYSPFRPFIHAGTFFFLAALIGFLIFQRTGHIQKGGAGRILAQTLEKTIPATIAMVALTTMSVVMRGTGQANVLAHGVARATGELYAFMAPFIGVLGAFMTGSNVASNILFGNFQQITAQVIGLKEAAVLGAQTAGAAAGNTIAPGKVLLGTTTAGILGREGDVLRITLPVALGLGALIGVVLIFLA
ncbi:MAG: L-lactate permease [candidate division NC10 bacterium]|nr:L-lactate permease [candidate division NC10 bacterium]